mmetsp:Transcript_60016/g.160835  ORF Transcript_60016/g.160835 Transcript_60016/m.160835 type:complete len:481 (-) Transcript_60016:51-1493(-)
MRQGDLKDALHGLCHRALCRQAKGLAQAAAERAGDALLGRGGLQGLALPLPCHLRGTFHGRLRQPSAQLLEGQCPAPEGAEVHLLALLHECLHLLQLRPDLRAAVRQEDLQAPHPGGAVLPVLVELPRGALAAAPRCVGLVGALALHPLLVLHEMVAAPQGGLGGRGVPAQGRRASNGDKHARTARAGAQLLERPLGSDRRLIVAERLAEQRDDHLVRGGVGRSHALTAGRALLLALALGLRLGVLAALALVPRLLLSPLRLHAVQQRLRVGHCSQLQAAAKEGVGRARVRPRDLRGVPLHAREQLASLGQIPGALAVAPQHGGARDDAGGDSRTNAEEPLRLRPAQGRLRLAPVAAAAEPVHRCRVAVRVGPAAALKLPEHLPRALQVPDLRELRETPVHGHELLADDGRLLLLGLLLRLLLVLASPALGALGLLLGLLLDSRLLSRLRGAVQEPLLHGEELLDERAANPEVVADVLES